MLISKQYCNFVINNEKLLDLMKPILDDNMELYRYTLGYTWVTFYMEECIKKTYTTMNDRFVFDLRILTTSSVLFCLSLGTCATSGTNSSVAKEVSATFSQ